MFVNNAGSVSQCWKWSFSDNNNRMYAGIVAMLDEQKEAFMEISTRLIGRVTFSTVSFVISQVTVDFY